jgi:hypothetical protein
MKNAKRSGSVWASAAVAFALVAWVSIRPTHAEAQTPGNNAIFDSGGHCSPCDSSTAFVDASVFGGTSFDFCGVIYGILSATGYPSAGEVVDARGLPFTGTSMTCPTGTTPWNNGTTYLSNVNSTILLAGGPDLAR